MAEPPKSGRVRLQDYEASAYLTATFRSHVVIGFDLDPALQAEAFLQQIDPVVEQLRDELPQAGYDRRGVGQLIGQLMQFQEDALGVNVSANETGMARFALHAAVSVLFPTTA